MKNLKKALSLVLASAMLIGMMVVGTGAAHSDVKAEHNEEAIAVVTALGIMGAGDTFNPDGKITRGEMAVIMTNMLGLDTKDFKGAANFTDAGWAADYIDACYANGIMAGISATEFGTNVQVTTAQATLMMLKALGYYQEAKLNDWMLDTIKTAAKIDLLDGIDASATAVMTRNEVAQLALNALTTNTVLETVNGSSTSVKGEGFEITVDSTVSIDDELKTDYDYDKTEAKDDYQQLIEKLFKGQFIKEKATDDLGFAGIVWKDTKKATADQEIIFVADEADKVLVSDGKYTTAMDLYKAKVDKKAATVDGLENDAIVAGSEVFYFLNKDNKVADIVVLNYSVAKVTKIDTELTKKEKEDGTTAKVTLKNVATEAERIVKDNNFAGFDYAKNDYVMVIEGKNADNENAVFASYAAEMVEGKISAVKGAEVAIDGTYYKDLTTSLANKDEVKVVVNKAGQIIFVASKNAASKSADYAYIYNVVDASADENEDGVKGASKIAYMVLADGTKAKYTIDSKSAVPTAGNVYAYAIDTDGELQIKVAKEQVKTASVTKLDKDSKFMTTEDGNVYADSKTEFVFSSWNTKGDKLTVTTETGVKNVNIKNTTVTVVYNKDDMNALVVFATVKQAGLDADVEYVVVTDATAVKTTDDDNNDFYTFQTNAGEMVFKNPTTVPTFTKGQVVTYKLVEGYAQLTATAAIDNTIAVVGEDFFVLKGATTEYTYDEADMYTVTFEYDTDDSTKLEELTVSNSAELKKDAVVKVFANEKNEVKALFVIKEIK